MRFDCLGLELFQLLHREFRLLFVSNDVEAVEALLEQSLGLLNDIFALDRVKHGGRFGWFPEF